MQRVQEPFHFMCAEVTRHILSIAGIVIEVFSSEPDFLLQSWKSYAPPSSSGGLCRLTLQARWSEACEASSGALLFDSGGVWKVFREDHCLVFQLASPAMGPAPYETARIEEDFTRGEIRLSRKRIRSRPADPLQYPLDEVLFNCLLGRGLGAEVHACGVVDGDGRGKLFVGHSGAGKSTLARLWEKRGVTILSDDRIILREIEGKTWMFGTPWHGDGCYADPRGVPLSAVFVLRHGEENAVERMPAGTAACELFTRGFPPFYDRDALDFTLGFLTKVAHEVPCHRFSFLPEESALDALEALTATLRRA